MFPTTLIYETLDICSFSSLIFNNKAGDNLKWKVSGALTSLHSYIPKRSRTFSKLSM